MIIRTEISKTFLSLDTTDLQIYAVSLSYRIEQILKVGLKFKKQFK